MLIRIKDPSDIQSSEITSESVYQGRRQFIKQAGLLSAGLIASPFKTLHACEELDNANIQIQEQPNSYKEITNYNNFYEYSTDKKAVAELAKNLKTSPWSLSIEGEVDNPIVLDVDKILKRNDIEDRTYRLRCVEGWSMVIPWQGISLCNLLKLAQPSSKAKYVEFITKLDPKTFYGQRQSTMEWPYREGLRIDEAMHPLTILATGLYGKPMPNQNGAPIRLVVPWKYGFKSIKSIVTIRLTEQMPVSTWSEVSASEYGFYANVNPDVSHPRWSQRRENRIGEFKKRKTLLFNGYADQVAHLYSGMDLKKYY
jgi:methionine sulfoxide reductase catalytic subunit